MLSSTASLMNEPRPAIRAPRRLVGSSEGLNAYLQRCTFRPIAAGEVVLDSRDAPLFSHLRLYHNDAAAIEMEGAGVVHAAHLNDSLPALVIRRRRRGDSRQAGAAARPDLRGGLSPSRTAEREGIPILVPQSGWGKTRKRSDPAPSSRFAYLTTVTGQRA